MAYALKFLSKRELARDYVVPPLEALWCAEDTASFTAQRDKSRWRWTVLSLVPDWLGEAHVETARVRARAKAAPAPAELRLETLAEGLCVQTLHVGSYDDETPVLATMHEEVIPGRGLRMTGKHHEIYLSDARRTAPAKRRTILRQPVEPARIPTALVVPRNGPVTWSHRTGRAGGHSRRDDPAGPARARGDGHAHLRVERGRLACCR